ncbi:ATP-binding protein [Natrinema halophilum]|uniref:histidine kinase n=1 Tax=Natrinema halophilum TaxID=1699371 RepID=A0A7D5GH05_9EURY|nr:PAS domain-containing sensor histidine kinase [Natrinema halophilum]QLG48714.1 PAS domain-containing sensor histidine kinase [Natrinema halophilum]
MDNESVTLPSVLRDLNTGITLHEIETGAILDVNEAVEELYGYSTAELRTMAVEDFTAPSTKYTQEEAIRRIQAAGSGDPQSFEWQIERSNGEYRWASVDLTPTTIDDGKYVIAEVCDITVYRTREQLLRLLNRVIRHNLRNEMNILMGYADRIKSAIENNDLREEVETIESIASEVGRLSESIHEIEHIVEPAATERQRTNLQTVVQNRAGEIEAEYPAVDLTVDAPSSIWVTADKGLQYALDHALDNAITHNDLETPTVRVTVTDDPENDRGVVQIADDGPPIPDIETDVLDTEADVHSTYHGSGVGLWVMKWCVDSLGGQLTFEENTPRGNIVRISLPKENPPESATQQASNPV